MELAFYQDTGDLTVEEFLVELINDPTTLQDLVDVVAGNATDIQDLLDLLEGEDDAIATFITALYDSGLSYNY